MSNIVSVSVSTPHMVAEIDGPIGWMIFNRPERRNAVSLDMWQAIPEILHRFEADPAVRVIVLKGAGDKAFVSGADISQFEKARSTAEANAEYDRISEEASKALAECRKPTIAMIRGFCIGGGLAIAIGCDIRIATEESRFGIPAARLGVGYGAAGVKKLVDLIGPAYTKEIFLTGRHFTAHEAREMGLANRIVPDVELESYIRKYSATIADNAPLTMLALKAAVGEILRGHEADWARCDRLVAACFDSRDFIEGRRAFMEKRRPVFRGN